MKLGFLQSSMLYPAQHHQSHQRCISAGLDALAGGGRLLGSPSHSHWPSSCCQTASQWLGTATPPLYRGTGSISVLYPAASFHTSSRNFIIL